MARQSRNAACAGVRRADLTRRSLTPLLTGLAVLAALAVLGGGVSPPAAGAEPGRRALADLSLEELGDITVYSVSRREQSLAEAPASIYVISREDIRRY